MYLYVVIFSFKWIQALKCLQSYLDWWKLLMCGMRNHKFSDRISEEDLFYFFQFLANFQRMTAILILFRIKSASRKDLPKTWKFIIKCQNVLQYFAEINRLRTWSFCYTALVSCQNFFIDISIKINQFCWFSLSKKLIYI